MAAFLYLCNFILGVSYLFTVNAQSFEDELIYGSGKSKIVGGESIKIDAAPYLAQILDEDIQICGSSILSQYWIVTAAHCVVDGGDYSILTGSTYRSKGRNRYEIAEIIVHEGFNLVTCDNDIALIKVQNPIKFNPRQKPISISKKLPVSDDHLTIAGYGHTGTYRAASKVLLSTVVPVIPIEICEQQYAVKGDNITNNMFCAGAEDRDSCQGDSGGPAVINDKLVGIVSFGYECAADDLPGVYTKIANYVDWINAHTGLKL